MRQQEQLSGFAWALRGSSAEQLVGADLRETSMTGTPFFLSIMADFHTHYKKMH
jgi:hypothetical protein